MRGNLLAVRILATTTVTVGASRHVFSVHDDILAYPQYKVVFSDGFILEADASSRLASVTKAQTTAASNAVPDDSNGELSHIYSSSEDKDHDGNKHNKHHNHHEDDDPSGDTYEIIKIQSRPYLCTIPTISNPPMNETAEAVARAEEEKELARASVRGWEMLQGMQDQCMYFVSGWWSYEFCYDGHVKQFHPLPPRKDVPRYPPAEDPSTPSYILGRVTALTAVTDRHSHSKTRRRSKEHQQQQQQHRGDGAGHRRGEISDGRTSGQASSTEVRVKGDVRYLVQKLGRGTICDLTGKERTIEIQFHCHPYSNDRIGWIKEVTTCSYLIIIYTPRLCHDVAFLPPRNSQAYAIACQRILASDQDVDRWGPDMAEEGEKKTTTTTTTQEGVGGDDQSDGARLVIGGVEVGARKLLGGGGSGGGSGDGQRHHSDGGRRIDRAAASTLSQKHDKVDGSDHQRVIKQDPSPHQYHKDKDKKHAPHHEEVIKENIEDRESIKYKLSQPPNAAAAAADNDDHHRNAGGGGGADDHHHDGAATILEAFGKELEHLAGEKGLKIEIVSLDPDRASDLKVAIDQHRMARGTTTTSTTVTTAITTATTTTGGDDGSNGEEKEEDDQNRRTAKVSSNSLNLDMIDHDDGEEEEEEKGSQQEEYYSFVGEL